MKTIDPTLLRRVRVILWLLVAAFGAMLSIGWYQTRPPTAAPEPKPYATPFKLTDQNGKEVTEKDFLGKPTAWFYGFTHCPDVCPTALAEMAQVLEQLGQDADKLRVVFVSVDPARDTPAVLKQYAEYFDPRIIALTGTDEQLRIMTRARYVYFEKVGDGESYEMEHTAGVQLATADGRFFGTLDGHEPLEIRLMKVKRLIGG